VLKDEGVNARIAEAFAAEGTDAWFASGAAARFLAPDYDPAEWTKVDDILDVWFESGSTHAFTLEVRADNARAIALYEERGYEKFGTVADYYEDGASALRYRKRLVD